MMVPYGITLDPLTKDLRDADPRLISPFYANDAAFEGLVRRSTAKVCLLMERGPDRGYLPNPAKYIFIAYNPEEKETAKR